VFIGWMKKKKVLGSADSNVALVLAD